jgi:hypothetical protein
MQASSLSTGFVRDCIRVLVLMLLKGDRIQNSSCFLKFQRPSGFGNTARLRAAQFLIEDVSAVAFDLFLNFADLADFLKSNAEGRLCLPLNLQQTFPYSLSTFR